MADITMSDWITIGVLYIIGGLVWANSINSTFKKMPVIMSQASKTWFIVLASAFWCIGIFIAIGMIVWGFAKLDEEHD